MGEVHSQPLNNQQLFSQHQSHLPAPKTLTFLTCSEVAEWPHLHGHHPMHSQRNLPLLQCSHKCRHSQCSHKCRHSQCSHKCRHNQCSHKCRHSQCKHLARLQPLRPQRHK